MRGSILVIVSVLVVALAASYSPSQIAEQKFANGRAEAGRVSYLKAVAAAREELSQKQLGALKVYLKELTVGRDAATRAGDLQTAIAIDAEVKQVNEAVADLRDGKDSPAKSSPQLVITRARYGVPNKYLDVTARIQQCVHDDAIVSKDINVVLAGLPDPAPGPDKTLVIEGKLGGKRFRLESEQKLSFGKAAAE
ncbi:MAG: hypothetical protein JWN24_1958 [Phycisphaerales bacterium]|nr:hypothetical protein [Phycisphaerales bacterium]